MTEFALLTGQAFNGISLASILLLVALGLALSFGLMGVINMAHGELLMIGGYLTYMMLQVLPHGIGYLFGMVAAFAGTGIFGAILEMTLIRRLYGRPLDTLLATWGVSLIMQQGARSIFGPIGDEVTAPKWLTGSLNVSSGALMGLSLPVVRMFIILLSAAVFGLIVFIILRTRVGLLVQAVHQDRDMAEALGINTRRVDLAVFALGSAVAGLTGSALALIAPVTPTVGQNYIVYAFLVVILGGLGSLLGTLFAALLVGIFSAGCQIFTGVSTSDVLLLLFVIAFIQFRPRGIITISSRSLEGS